MDDKILQYIESSSGKRFDYVKRSGLFATSHEVLEPNKIVGVLNGILKTKNEILQELESASGLAAEDQLQALKKILNNSYLFYHQYLPLVVDARDIGNSMRFIRKSCRPNAVLKGIFVESKQTDKRISNTNLTFAMAIMVTHQIPAGSEIFLPLDFHDGNICFKYLCGCQSDINVITWFSPNCLMPRGEEENSPILEKWRATQKTEDSEEESIDEDDGNDDGEPIRTNKKQTLKERLAAATSMRPSRYLPMSYKPMAPFPVRSFSKIPALRKLSPNSIENSSFLENSIENSTLLGTSLDNSCLSFKQKSSFSMDRKLLQHRKSTTMGLKRPPGRPSLENSNSNERQSLQIQSSPRKKVASRKIENSLSPPPSSSRNRQSLTREERKLQMYIETIERIEARENKKRKAD